ncbi:hypothetical protein ACFQH8_03860 [Halomicroarcula sp. GCM10025710]
MAVRRDTVELAHPEDVAEAEEHGGRSGEQEEGTGLPGVVPDDDVADEDDVGDARQREPDHVEHVALDRHAGHEEADERQQQQDGFDRNREPEHYVADEVEERRGGEEHAQRVQEFAAVDVEIHGDQLDRLDTLLSN